MFTFEQKHRIMREVWGIWWSSDLSVIEQIQKAPDKIKKYGDPIYKEARAEFDRLQLIDANKRTVNQNIKYGQLERYLREARRFQWERKNSEAEIKDTTTRWVEWMKSEVIKTWWKEATEWENMWNNHVTNLRNISDKIKSAIHDASLETNVLRLGELDFINNVDDIEYSVKAYIWEGTPLYGDKELQKELKEVFIQIGYARGIFNDQILLHGHEHKREQRVNDKLRDFFHHMSVLEGKVGVEIIASSSEVKEAAEFKEAVKTASPAELLEMYKKTPKEDLMKKSIIVHALMQNHILAKGIIITKGENGKYEAVDWTESTEQADQIDSVLTEIDPNHIDSFKLSATLDNIDFDIKEELSISSLANAIMEKYKITYSDWTVAKYEDLHDDSIIEGKERSEILKKIIKDKVATAETKEEKQDLNYLLELEGIKPKEFTSDLVNVWNFMLIENEFLEDWDLWKALWEKYDGRNVERIIETILTGNGGMNMVVLAIWALYSIFKGKFWYVLWGTIWILGLQTAEENFAGTGAQKKISELLNNISPWLGGMVDWVLDKTGISKPNFKINHMRPEFEDTYRDLYIANNKKLEEAKYSDAVAEEDFAQIYGQLLNDSNFRNANIQTIRSAADAENFHVKSPLKPIFEASIDSYKEWLTSNIKEDWKNVQNRKITDEQVRFVIKELLKSQDTQWDLTWADLFVEWVEEWIVINSSEDFRLENEVLSWAFGNISHDHPHKDRIESILAVSQEWSIENGMIKMWIDGKQVKQAEELIAELNKLKGGLTWDHLAELTAIITALTALKTKSEILEKKENFLEGVYKGTDKRWFGLEKVFKNTADAVAYGAVTSLHFLGFENISLPQTDNISIEMIDQKIDEWNNLLENIPDWDEQKEIIEAIKLLQLYKIERLKVEWSDISTDKARADYIKWNKESILKDLSEIDLSMQKLQNPNLENLMIIMMYLFKIFEISRL